MTERPSVIEVADVVAVVDLFVTVHPGYPLAAAVDKICDLEKIFDVRDRRAILRGVEARQELAGTLRARRAAA